jgi:OOP family OmpA-OmpF porin
MKKLLLILAALTMSGCSSVHFNRSQVLERGNNIASLKNGLDRAMANQVDILAPNSYQKAAQFYKDALKSAEKSKNPNAGNDIALKGLHALDEANKLANNARGVFVDSLATMKSAEDAGATTLYTAEFNKLEKELKSAAKKLEEGDTKLAMEQNSGLAKEFAALELKTLKVGISEQADQALDEATKAGAKKLAPITLANAKNELDIAKKIIQVEKGNLPKAQFHATRAKYQAMRAKYIAELVSNFKSEKLTKEQIVLWYQDQLRQIHAAMPDELSFDKPNRKVVEEFEQDLSAQLNNLKESDTRAIAAEKKIAKLSGMLEAKPGNTLMEQATRLENFREASQLFDKKEAVVLKKNHTIIIRAYGFYFPSGKSELLPRNFSLLNKIVQAILKFPKSRIEVVGHTDSTGTKSKNLKLSEERAKNIASFLTDLAGIPPSRVSYEGVGDEEPIANNQSEEGRAQNRRIEILIKG